ncbi:MAG: hypothetical protein AAGD06_32560, partial [Acidobacteriota bacterium]
RRDNWLRRKLQGTRPLTVDELYEMLDALGLSASEFFDGYVQQENPTRPSLPSARLTNPRALLAAQGSSATDGLLRALVERPPAPLPPDTALAGLHERILALDELRAVDPNQARFGALDWLRTTHGRALRRSRVVWVSHYASALGAWASLQLDMARPEAAAAALDHAFELHAPSPYTVPYADLLVRTADVLHSLDAPGDAIPLLHFARSIVALYDVPDLADRSSLALGRLLIGEGRHRSALPVLRTLLDSRDPHHRGGAAVLLVEVLQHQGDITAALAIVELIDLEALPTDQALKLRVRAAVLRHTLGDPSGVAEVGLLLGRVGELPPLDALRLFLDLAQLALDLGGDDVLARSAGTLQQVLSTRLAPWPHTKASAAQVLHAARNRQLSRDCLGEARRALPSSAFEHR